MTIRTLDGLRPGIADDTWVAPDANVIGRVVRALDAAAIAGLKPRALTNQRNMRRFRDTLAPV